MLKLTNFMKLFLTKDENKKLEIFKDELLTQLGIKWVDVDETVVERYRKITKKGNTYSDNEIKCRINRAINCGRKTIIINNVIIVNYGNMELRIDTKDNLIYYITNSKYNKYGNIDREMKRRIGQVYKEVFKFGRY